MAQDKTYEELALENSALLKENKSLNRKVRLMKESLGRFDFLKKKYDFLLEQFDEKNISNIDQYVSEAIEKKTYELTQINEQLQDSVNFLKEASSVDFLTSLGNRRTLNKVFHDELNRAKRYEYYLNFMVIDVDDFKKYNDTYGHSKGDTVLQTLGEILTNFSRRANDFAFRFGGEEFVYISSHHNKEDFSKMCESLLGILRKKAIEHKASEKNILTISIGAVVVNNLNITQDKIFEIADENLYKAKRRGKDCFVISEV